MFKNFLMKQMLKRQMKDLPADQQDKIIKAIEENPEFFQTISQEIEQKTKQGKDQMAAALEVMRTHQNKLRDILGGK
jgi:hypothetical protein